MLSLVVIVWEAWEIVEWLEEGQWYTTFPMWVRFGNVSSVIGGKLSGMGQVFLEVLPFSLPFIIS